MSTKHNQIVNKINYKAFMTNADKENEEEYSEGMIIENDYIVFNAKELTEHLNKKDYVFLESISDKFHEHEIKLGTESKEEISKGLDVFWEILNYTINKYKEIHVL